MAFEMDSHCLKRLRDGDQDTWEALITEHQDRILNYLYHLEGHYDEALDLTQETFYRAWRGIRTFREGEAFLPWLYTIARNVRIEKYRRKSHPQFSLEEAAEVGFEPSDTRRTPQANAESSESAERVRRALQDVPDEYREAVVLRFMDDLSYEEIAAAQGCAVGTAKSRVFRGKELLAKSLEGQVIIE